MGGVLVPIEKHEGTGSDELLLGRLPEFCPEAFAPVIQAPAAPGQSGAEVKRPKNKVQSYNILTDPQIPLPNLDSIL